MPLKHWLLLCIGFILYLIVGGLIFMNLERERETIDNFELAALHENIYEILFQMDQNFYRNDTAKESVQGLLNSKEIIVNKIFNYCDGPPLGEKNNPKWNFYNSVFYGFTIVTTIGYGNLIPTNDWSRLATILYALIGIPLNGILLAKLGDYFSDQLMMAYEESKNHHKLVMIINVSVYFMSGIILFFFIPAALISNMEHWSFFQSIYFSIISLSTIGFGDFVAGHQDGGKDVRVWVYKIFIIIWTELGLAYLCMILSFVAHGHNRLHSAIAKTIEATTDQFLKDLEDMQRALDAELQTSSPDSQGMTLPNLPSQFFSRVADIVKEFAETQTQSEAGDSKQVKIQRPLSPQSEDVTTDFRPSLPRPENGESGESRNEIFVISKPLQL